MYIFGGWVSQAGMKGNSHSGGQCCQVLPNFPGQPSEKIRPIAEKIWPVTEFIKKS